MGPRSGFRALPFSRRTRARQTSLSDDVKVSSIDGFQGREADIVVFVTVRCNENREIGFLKDLRRMDVALTRARAGLIIVGNRATLTGGNKSRHVEEAFRHLAPVKIEPEV